MLHRVVANACTVVIAITNQVIGQRAMEALVSAGAKAAASIVERLPAAWMMRPPVMPASRLPVPMMANSGPKDRSEMCSCRVANSTKVAWVAANARFISVTANASARSSGWCSSQSSPLRTSPARLRGRGSAVAGRYEPRTLAASSAATTKLTASTPKGNHTTAAKSTLPSGMPR